MDTKRLGSSSYQERQVGYRTVCFCMLISFNSKRLFGRENGGARREQGERRGREGERRGEGEEGEERVEKVRWDTSGRHLS